MMPSCVLVTGFEKEAEKGVLLVTCSFALHFSPWFVDIEISKDLNVTAFTSFSSGLGERSLRNKMLKSPFSSYSPLSLSFRPSRPLRKPPLVRRYNLEMAEDRRLFWHDIHTYA